MDDGRWDEVDHERVEHDAARQVRVHIGDRTPIQIHERTARRRLVGSAARSTHHSLHRLATARSAGARRVLLRNTPRSRRTRRSGQIACHVGVKPEAIGVSELRDDAVGDLGRPLTYELTRWARLILLHRASLVRSPVVDVLAIRGWSSRCDARRPGCPARRGCRAGSTAPAGAACRTPPARRSHRPPTAGTARSVQLLRGQPSREAGDRGLRLGCPIEPASVEAQLRTARFWRSSMATSEPMVTTVPSTV